MAVATQNETRSPAVVEKKGSLIRIMAAQVNLDPMVYADTIKATCFPDGKATNEQLAAFLVVANQYSLNPLTKEIYAFPGKGGGVVPMVGIDGWISLANRNPQFDGMELVENNDPKGNLISTTCTIWRKDRKMPIVVTEWISECKRNTEPWNGRPRRMLRHKATIQGIRYAFGYTGIADPDDFDQPIDVVIDPAEEAIPASRPSMPKPKVIETQPEPEPAEETLEQPEPEGEAEPEKEAELHPNYAEAQKRGYTIDAVDEKAVSMYHKKAALLRTTQLDMVFEALKKAGK